eukprot:gene13383-9210_t
MRAQDGSSVEDGAGKTASKGFQVIVHGMINGAECMETTQMFVRTHLFFGADWSFMEFNDAKFESGVIHPTYNNNAEIITQLSDRALSPIPYFAFSAPFEFALQSTNPYGWPQIVVTLHSVENKKEKDTPKTSGGLQGIGESVIGYGRCFVPMENGHHAKRVRVMQLEHSTNKQKLVGMITREKPILRDLSYLCRGDDRVVLAAKPLSAHVDLTFSVVVNGLESCGFNA